MTLRWRNPAALVALVALLLGLGFLGTRAIWDPDEGRYTNVALNMLDSGDWLHPRRNVDVGHWTKPPVTYWAIAASMGLFGRNPWAARLPIACAYLACVYLAWRVGRRLAPGAHGMAALAYATMFVPAFSSQIITTDFILAAAQTLAMAAYVEARFGPVGAARRWIALMWFAFAVAFMTKGPPALLPLLAVAAFEVLSPPPPRPGRLAFASGALIFLAVALPWYLVVVIGQPGLLEYFVGAEVVGRFASDRFDRHGEWYGWLTVYGATVLLGTLPWTRLLLRWVRGLPAQVRAWRTPAARIEGAPDLLLALWVMLPLLVFCLAQSRMPLYILPLFVPMAVIVARQWRAASLPWPRTRWLVLVVLLYTAIRLAAAAWPTHKDAGAWADAIRERAVRPVTVVLFVEDMARYGLNLHLDAEIEKISLEPLAQSRFNPRFDEDLALELSEEDPGAIWIARQERWDDIRQRIAARGYRAVARGTPFQGRVVFDVEPRPGRTPLSCTDASVGDCGTLP
ncbi:glycosyltransferase family 39 protein [Chiayiivirga flava]|uniref:4-amino-4-deoxy-L-arabinose transferase-like glycosyltransferase n=1 Tax=Chiayiivirga flava TaxID=659595 RepID=A0A7W8D9H4_9GAMM|nr:4-amino-4-deoxy-L-arabinose transferase-like glycosyltransferase [Chiayiivirga flava]